MKEFTFIIPTKINEAKRLQNLIICLNYYSKVFPEATFIIVEEDKKTKIPTTISTISPNITHILIEPTHTHFNKMKCFNVGLHHVRTEFTILQDMDCIANVEGFMDSVEHLRSGFHASHPFNSWWIECNKNSPLEAEFTKTLDYNIFKNGFHLKKARDKDSNFAVVRDPKMAHPPGGIVIFNTRDIKHAGGGNEQFVGWGYEDDEIIKRLIKLNYMWYNPTNPDFCVFHLYHTDLSRTHTVSKSSTVYRQTLANKNLKEHIRNSRYFYHE